MKLSIWVGLLAVGILSGCTETPQANAAEPQEPVIVTNAPEPAKPVEMGKKKLSETVQVGMAAPDFSVKDERGKEWKLSDYKGKTVLLDFWGFWCPTCVDELPELRGYSDELMGTDFVMIGMNTDTDIEASELNKKFVDHKVNWRQGLVADDAELSKDYAVRTFPMKVLVDKEGKIAYIDHFIDLETIKKHL